MEGKSKKSVGRPQREGGRNKIGLSISDEAERVLDELSKNSGKTKSRLFEEALILYKERKDIIDERLRKIMNGEKDAILDMSKI